MYNDEELMLFAESYQKMQRKGIAGKKIIGTVSERLNESIDSQIKAAKLKKMVKALLECEKMKSAKEFLNSISLTECTAKDLAKVEKLYKLYEEIEDVEEAEDDEADGDPDVAVIKSGFIADYKSDKLSLYKFLQAIVEFGQWIMTHGKNEERNVMKSLLAVLEDEFIPKFAELPGATDDSTVDDEPADDEESDDAIPADTEDDDVDIDVDAEIDDEDDDTSDDEPAEEEEDVDVEVDDEPADESKDDEEIPEAEDDEENVEESGEKKTYILKLGPVKWEDKVFGFNRNKVEFESDLDPLAIDDENDPDFDREYIEEFGVNPQFYSDLIEYLCVNYSSEIVNEPKVLNIKVKK